MPNLAQQTTNEPHDMIMETPRCLSPGDLPSHIKPRYRAFALVATSAQVDCLEPMDEEILIVCCNWLMWQQLSAEGRHAVYFELGTLDWSEPDSLDIDLFHRANDWLLDLAGRDPTVFHDVSIGRTFGAEISLASVIYYRIERSLRPLIKRFCPNEILFYDFKYDFNIFNAKTRRLIIRTLAEECGIRFVDCAEKMRNDRNADEEGYVPKQHGRFASLLLATYSWGLESITRLRCIFSRPDRRVLLLIVSNSAAPLARDFIGGRFTPIFLGRTIPKNFSLLWRCLREGVLLVRPRLVSLSKNDRLRLREITGSLEPILSEPAEGVLGFVRAFIRHQFLETGQLERRAQEIIMEAGLLDRYRPRRLVVDGVRNSRHLINTELARPRGIAVDYIWHSPLTPQAQQFGAIGGDPRQPVFVDRCLSWGDVNNAWLDRVDAKQPRERVGCPIAAHYHRHDKTAASPSAEAKSCGDTNVLLLLYTLPVLDMSGLQSNMYATFVNCVRMLKRLGYINIAFKMHPAPGRWKKRDIEEIARYFEIECEIWKSEPISECLDWADIVIGPMQTGAFFEALAAGKPYHALLIPPFSHDPTFYADYPYHQSIDDLAKALETSPPAAAAKKLLNGVYGVDEFASTTRRFWQVFEDDFQ